ncbi:MAG: hypothetical protein Q3986_07535 [Akkermansia sp.]|nr:hypothetical protein [Akkermansia sp.]
MRVISTFKIKGRTVQIPLSPPTASIDRVTFFFNILKPLSRSEGFTDIVPTYEEQEDWCYTHLVWVTYNGINVPIPMRLSNQTLEVLRKSLNVRLKTYEQINIRPEDNQIIQKIIEERRKKDLAEAELQEDAEEQYRKQIEDIIDNICNS